MAKASDEKAVIADIVKQRDKDGKSWSEIVDNVGMSTGKVMTLYLQGSVKERFKGTNDSALAKEVASARKAGDSWGIIAVKGQFSEARARSLFEQATGKSAAADRLGKGGRPAPGTTRAPKATKAAKAPAAKKGTTKAPAAKKAATKGGGSAKKAAGSTEGLSELLGGTGTAPKGRTTINNGKGPIIPLVEMDVEQLGERLNGKTITVGRSGKVTRIAVKSVKSLDDDGLMEFFDAKNGGQRQVQVQDIVKASR